jgi:hypothetical protein
VGGLCGGRVGPVKFGEPPALTPPSSQGGRSRRKKGVGGGRRGSVQLQPENIRSNNAQEKFLLSMFTGSFFPLDLTNRSYIIICLH